MEAFHEKIAYSTEISDLVKQFLDEELDHVYYFNESEGDFAFVCKNDEVIGNLSVLLAVEDNCFTSFVRPLRPVKKMGARITSELAKFVCKVNLGVPIGHFDFDIDSGEITYAFVINCMDCLPSEVTIASSIYLPISMLNAFGDGIIKILNGEMKAKEAYEMCLKNIPAD